MPLNAPTFIVMRAFSVFDATLRRFRRGAPAPALRLLLSPVGGLCLPRRPQPRPRGVREGLRPDGRRGRHSGHGMI